ncbi:MAG TPA: hypothetical protein VM554_07170 [Acidisarcina sp.]|nr:hypothetical protein [Acidisarcina sp.]
MSASESGTPQRQRLKQARAEFEALLRKLLPECARGRSGLFGQHARALGQETAARYYKWPEADRLLALSEEITALQESLGDMTEMPLLSAYQGYRAEKGSDIPSEPRMALRFLQELKREEFAARGLPINLERYREEAEEAPGEISGDDKKDGETDEGE